MKTLISRITTFFGIALLAAAMVFFFTSCQQEPDNNKKENPLFPEAKGKLTINGLGSFNNKYVYVQGIAGGKLIVGITDITDSASDITYKLTKISGGKAEVPLYYADTSGSFVAYSGNDTISPTINIDIIENSPIKASNILTTNILDKKSITSGLFSNGNMTFDWGNFDNGSNGNNGSGTGTFGDFNYKYKNNSVTIMSYKGSGGELIVPANIDGKPVTKIDNNAFENKKITSVTIGNSVTSIGDSAFYNNQLTSITIGANVDFNFGTFNYSFESAYRDNQMAAGTYTRPNTSSITWTKVN